MTRTLRKGTIQNAAKPKKTIELKVNAENMSMNQGNQKTEFVCFDCGAAIMVNNSVLKDLEGTIHCPICALKNDVAEEEPVEEYEDEEISIEELANQVKKLTELSQQQIEIQQSILASLGL